MAIEAPPVPQHVAALQRANAIRLARAQVKRDLESGATTIRDVLKVHELPGVDTLEDVDPAVAGMTIGELLCVPRRWGVVRMRRLLDDCSIGEHVRVGDLTTHRRRAIVALFEGHVAETAAERERRERRAAELERRAAARRAREAEQRARADRADERRAAAAEARIAQHDARRREVIAKMQAWADTHGKPPTAEEWRTRRGRSEVVTASNVQELFGSWLEALKAAALDLPARGRPRATRDPLDVECPNCRSAPGDPCSWYDPVADHWTEPKTPCRERLERAGLLS